MVSWHQDGVGRFLGLRGFVALMAEAAPSCLGRLFPGGRIEIPDNSECSEARGTIVGAYVSTFPPEA